MATPQPLRQMYALAREIPLRAAQGKDVRPVARVYFDLARQLLGVIDKNKKAGS